MRNSACGMVLCAARETPASFFDALKRRNIPAIMVVRPLSDPDFDFVGTDNFLGTQMATICSKWGTEYCLYRRA
jgi:LacI family transcriptional regulator